MHTNERFDHQYLIQIKISSLEQCSKQLHTNRILAGAHVKYMKPGYFLGKINWYSQCN